MYFFFLMTCGFICAGAAEGLFQKAFYQDMKKALKPNGVMCCQGIHPFYIQSFQMTEYLNPGRALSVCVCVCVSVCMSVRANNFHNCQPILMKLRPHDHKLILR